MRGHTETKPIYVYHGGSWRRYGWSRDLLSVTTLGDVICDPDLRNREDPAEEHIYSNPAGDALVVAATLPDTAVWGELDRIMRGEKAMPLTTSSIGRLAS